MRRTIPTFILVIGLKQAMLLILHASFKYYYCTSILIILHKISFIKLMLLSKLTYNKCTHITQKLQE